MELYPIDHIPEIDTNSNLPALIYQGVTKMGKALAAGDILVITSKVVAKWKGCVRRLEDIQPGPAAQRISQILGRPPAYCQMVLDVSSEIVRLAPGVMITRTHHGFVMANGGIDGSNTAHSGEYIYLPENLDELAQEIRDSLMAAGAPEIAIVLSDTFGRPWRNGQVDLAVGCAGLEPLLDLRNTQDDIGQTLFSTLPAIADELSAAADLVAGKTNRVPAVLIRGYHYPKGDSGTEPLIMPRERDLFGPASIGPQALAMLLQRHSVRVFQKRPVPKQLLGQILAAGQAAPSSHNCKPWHFHVIDQESALKPFWAALTQRRTYDMRQAGFREALVHEWLDRNKRTLETAAALIILSGKKRPEENPLDENGEIDRMLTIQSVALAGGQMLLAASFLGLGACWYAAPLFCADLVENLIALPEEYVPHGMLALGYAAEDGSAP